MGNFTEQREAFLMKTIRRYHLASSETRGSDTSYDLVFTDTGRMYVQATVQYDQTHKTGHVSDIFPESFSDHAINGVSLGGLVAKKLDELLPPKPLAWPDVPHLG
jgi:hypothetical protein